MQFQIWVYCYAIPVAIAIYLCSKMPSRRKEILTMHLFVAFSIILLSIKGVNLNWNLQIISLLIISLGILLSLYLLKFLGLVYVASSTLQESCLLLAGIVAVSTVGLIWGAIITSVLYTLAHFPRRIDWIHWHWKLPLLFIWAIVSIFLYSYFHQPLLNIAIHIVAGAILIRKGLLSIS
jgi:hypothetical protein